MAEQPQCPKCGASGKDASGKWKLWGTPSTGARGCYACGYTWSEQATWEKNRDDADQQWANKELDKDLRPNPDLDALFGVVSASADRAVSADESIKAAGGGPGWNERGKADPNDIGKDDSASPSGPSGPNLGNVVDVRLVEVVDAAAQTIGDAVADSVHKLTAGTTSGLGNGPPTTTPGTGTGSPPTTTPRGKNANPGTGEQYGSKAGSWAGRGIGAVLGTAVGAYFGGPAGAKVGQTIGQELGGKIGDKVGGEVGATADKAKDAALSPDSKDTLVKVMPEAAQSVIRWYRELDNATETILRYNFQLSQFSAEMGAVEAERDAREAFRGKDVGDRLAWSAEYLSRNEQERKDNAKELNILTRSVDNAAQGFKEKVVGELLKPLNTIAKYLNDILGLAEKMEDQAITPEEYMKSAAQRGDELARRGMDRQRSISDEMNRSSGRRFY